MILLKASDAKANALFCKRNSTCKEFKMSQKKPETSLKGRDARSGQFIPVKEARQRPNTTVVERVPLPGKGRK